MRRSTIGRISTAVFLVFCNLCQSAFAGAIEPPTETLGAKLRRLYNAAQVANPITAPKLVGQQPWVVSSGAWPANAAVTIGSVYTNGGNTYQVAIAGTTAASGGPTGTQRNALVTDGTASWRYIGFQVGDIVSNNGLAFQVATAGTPATTGTGPTPSSLSDGSIVYNFIGAQTAPVITQTTASLGGSYTNQIGVYLVGGSGAVIPFGTAVMDNTTRYRFTGGVPKSGDGASTIYTIGTNLTNNVQGNCHTATSGSPGYSDTCNYEGWTFNCECSKFQIGFDSQNQPLSFIVDGRYTDIAAFAVARTGNPGFITIDFTNAGGRAPHTITIESGNGAIGLSWIGLLPTDWMTYPSSPENGAPSYAGPASRSRSIPLAKHGVGRRFLVSLLASPKLSRLRSEGRE